MNITWKYIIIFIGHHKLIPESKSGFGDSTASAMWPALNTLVVLHLTMCTLECMRQSQVHYAHLRHYSAIVFQPIKDVKPAKLTTCRQTLQFLLTPRRLAWTPSSSIQWCRHDRRRDSAALCINSQSPLWLLNWIYTYFSTGVCSESWITIPSEITNCCLLMQYISI